MDFRNYDASIGRFFNMDKLSEGAPMHTPYRFAFNNPVYFSDPTGLFEQGFETCPTCPNKPEFKPYIDDPNNEYVYDPETNSVSEVIQLQETNIYTTQNNSLTYFGYLNDGIGAYGSNLANTTYKGGSFALWNGPTGRTFDGIRINEVKYRYSATNTGFNRYTGKGIKLSKVMTKGSLVGSIILQVPQVVEGFEKGTDEGIKQTGGGVGSVLGGMLGGATAGLIVGSETGPGALITGFLGAVVGGVVGEETMEFYLDKAMTPLTPDQKNQQTQKLIQSSQTVSGPLKY